MPTWSERWKSPWRWAFLGLVAISMVILGLTVREQFIQAQMSIGSALGSDTATTFVDAVLSKKVYSPPEHGRISTSQLMFALKVARLDSVFRANNVPRIVRQNELSSVFNRNVMSVAEYEWIANVISIHFSRDVSAAPYSDENRKRFRMVTESLLRATNNRPQRCAEVLEDVGAEE